MGVIPNHLGEIHSVGPATREQMIGADQAPALRLAGLGLVGRSEARAGFSFVRLRPAMSQLLASERGRGQVWLGDRWVWLQPGEAYATPPGVPHAYRASGAGVWRVCWACYPGDPAAGFRFPLAAPAIVKLDAGPLRLAIEGLCTAADATGAEVELWVKLIHLRVLAAIRAEALPDARLARLWAAVNQDLAHPWTLPELARLAALSREALRRLCLRHHGQSPLREVTRLRMQRAATLLRQTPDKVASIALRVGFTDPFAFSTAFKRVQGQSPGVYRSRLD